MRFKKFFTRSMILGRLGVENVGERCVVCGGGGRPKLVLEELVGCVDGGWRMGGEMGKVPAAVGDR